MYHVLSREDKFVVIIHNTFPQNFNSIVVCSGSDDKMPHRLGGLNTNFFFAVLAAGKSKIKVPAELVPAVSSFPGLQVAAFSLCPCTVERGLWCLFPSDFFRVFKYEIALSN